MSWGCRSGDGNLSRDDGLVLCFDEATKALCEPRSCHQDWRYAGENRQDSSAALRRFPIKKMFHGSFAILSECKAKKGLAIDSGSRKFLSIGRKRDGGQMTTSRVRFCMSVAPTPASTDNPLFLFCCK